MKILISPSKTMAKNNIKPVKRALLFETEKDYLKQTLEKYELNDLKSLLDVNDKLAIQNYERYQKFQEQYAALFTYTGAQYKAINASELNKKSLDYLDKHLLIVSGLYGLLKPFDCIAFYRLPMALKLDNLRLSDYWKPLIMGYLSKDLIINLTSKEYSAVLDNRLNIINIEFYVLKKGKYKAPSMEVKRVRGLFVRYLAEKQIQDLDKLKSFNIDHYNYDKHLSTTSKFVFVKTEE